MITKEQIKEGFAKYLDSEIIGKTPGLRKWMLAVSVAPLLTKLDEALDAPAIKELGYRTDDGMFDIDKAKADFLKASQEKGSVTEHLPMMGDITFSSADIERLWECMK